MRIMSRAVARCAMVIGLAAVTAGVKAERIEFGRGDDLALDQPRVFVGVEDPAVPDEEETPRPSEFGNGFLLDTGATGVLIGKLGHFDADELDFNPDLYNLEVNPITNFPVVYLEQGVAGFSALNVTTPHNIAFAGTTGDFSGGELDLTTQVDISNIRALAGSELDLGSFGGIIGMPGMVGRRVTMDMTTMTPLGFIGVDFDDGVGATLIGGGPSHVINLGQLPFEPNGSVPAGQAPTFEPLPTIAGIKTRQGGNEATDTMILDTGAQLTILFSSTVAALGIDLESATIDSVPVGGIGGSVVMPLIQIDEFGITTADGDELVFTDLIVGVLDIDLGDGAPDLGGIFGMNLLTTGYLQGLLSAENIDGLFNEVVLDFTNQSQWTMELFVNELYEPSDQPIFLPTELAAGLITNDPESGLPLTGGGGVIPEPGTMLLIGAGLCGAALRRRARRE